MTDIEKNNQLAKAKTSGLQKTSSNIVSRGFSDLALLDVEDRKIADEERLSQAREWFKKGYDYCENKEYDKAIEAYTNAITLNQNDGYAYNNRGSAYYNKGEYDRAIEDYNKAIVLDPNLAYAYNNRGLAYYKKGKYDGAIEDYSKAIALEPNGAYAYSNRGLAYESLGNKSMAISDYRKACDLGLEVGCENLQRMLQASLFKKEGQYRVNKESDKAIEPFSLIIEDVFHGEIHGEIRCVAIGEISKGNLRVGDYVMILGLNEKPRKAIIKGIEMEKKLLESAKKGDIIGILFESDQKFLTVKKGDFVVNM